MQSAPRNDITQPFGIMVQITASLHKERADAIIISNPNSSLRNQRGSPLLRLPAEIRNLILEYTFTVNRLMVDVDGDLNPDKLLFNTIDAKWIVDGLVTMLIPITTVCRQIYSETHTLPHVSNVMEVGLDDMVAFIEVLPQKVREFVKGIRVQTLTYRELAHVNELLGNAALAAFSTLPELEKVTLISLNKGTQLSAQEMAIASVRFNAYSVKQVVVEQGLIKI